MTRANTTTKSTRTPTCPGTDLAGRPVHRATGFRGKGRDRLMNSLTTPLHPAIPRHHQL